MVSRCCSKLQAPGMNGQAWRNQSLVPARKWQRRQDSQKGPEEGRGIFPLGSLSGLDAALLCWYALVLAAVHWPPSTPRELAC